MTAERKAAPVHPTHARENDPTSPRRGDPPRPHDITEAARLADRLATAGSFQERRIVVRRDGLRHDDKAIQQLFAASGGAWSVPLKLWTLYLWRSRDSADVPISAAQDAGILGFAGDQQLPEYRTSRSDSPRLTRGIRRCREGIGTIEHAGLGRREGRRMRMHREDGPSTAGLPRRWTHPSNDPKGTSGYFQLPAELILNGWLAALSGRALLTLMTLACEQDAGDAMVGGKLHGVWLSQQQRRDRYGLTDGTWQEGVRELRVHRLVMSMDRGGRDPETLEWRRQQVHSLQPDRLAEPADRSHYRPAPPKAP